MTTTVYKIRPDGVYLESAVVESDTGGIPSGYTRTAPPTIPQGYYAVMRNGWQLVQGTPPEYTTDNAVNISADLLRAEAYRSESDPLFFKSQRGEATYQEWLDKVAEIKARYPDEVTP